MSTEFNINRESLPTIEDFDWAVYDWLEMMDIFVEASSETQEFKKVPIIWAGAERVFQTKYYKEIRDVSGSLVPPLISVTRKGIKKDLGDKGEHWSNIPAIYDFMQGVLPIRSVIRQDKTAEFKNNYSYRKTGKINYNFGNEVYNGPGVVYETLYVPIPVYISINYNIDIWTSYRTQLNTIQQKFLTYVPAGNINRFIIGKRGHFFEAFLEGDFQEGSNIDNLEKSERKFLSTLALRVFGYIAGEEKNQNSPYVSKREGPAKLTFEVDIENKNK